MTQDVAAARVVEMAAWCEQGDPGAEGSILLSASVANEHAADLRSLLARVSALEGSNEGLTADLHDAVQTAYNRGATEWARLNYPKWIEWLESQSSGNTGQLNDSPQDERERGGVRCTALKRPPIPTPRLRDSDNGFPAGVTHSQIGVANHNSPP